MIFLVAPGRPSRETGRGWFGRRNRFVGVGDLDVVRRRKTILPVEPDQYPIRVRCIEDLQLGILLERELLVRLSRVVEQRASFVDRMRL